MKIVSYRSGFSFIEIIVSIAIIALMVGIAVGAFQYLSKAKYTATDVNLKSLKIAIQTLNADTGAYPITIGDLLIKPSDGKVAKHWRGPYLEQEPVDGWKNPFVYQLKSKGAGSRPYELYSWGPNGEGSPENEHISVWNI